MSEIENPGRTCYLCQTATAEAMKIEVEIDYSDEEEISIPVTRPICLACNARWFDGTEDYPKLLPLA